MKCYTLEEHTTKESPPPLQKPIDCLSVAKCDIYGIIAKKPSKSVQIAADLIAL